MAPRISPEEQAILDRIAAARNKLAAKVAPPPVTVVAKSRPPGLVALFDDTLACARCKRNIRKGSRYVLVRDRERRLRYHEGTCAPRSQEVVTDGA